MATSLHMQGSYLFFGEYLALYVQLFVQGKHAITNFLRLQPLLSYNSAQYLFLLILFYDALRNVEHA